MQFNLSKIQQDVVDKIVELHKDKKSLNEGQSKKAYTNGLDVKEMILLEAVFAEHLVGERIHQAMVLVEFEPWSIHTDYNKGDKNPGKAILIPYQTQDAHTLIFNEECFTTIEDLPEVDMHVDKDMHEQFLSHCKIEQINKVTHNYTYKWQRGTAVIWDRKKLHASDNFLVNGIKEKIALVIFTEKQ
jgi:hypothetical protein